MAVPEFVLRKLLVPGSFKTNPKGFAFILLYSFAPATITRFCIFVGNSQVSDNLITLSSKEFQPTGGEKINSKHPMILPVGVEISIEVKDTPLTGPVRILATTKEVGDIEFSISGNSKNEKKSKPLKPGLLTCFTKPKYAEITISTEKRIGKASPFLQGHFIEHLEHCIYDGIWSADGSELRQDTLDLIRQLNPSIIRYPGGNFASGYHWEDGIGLKSKRPRRHDAAWQAEESNQVGTDEFLSFCAEVHAEPILVVNDGSGTPEEAARWVAYCNDPIDTEQGARRAQNGHPEPYQVKYWGVGNEVWGAWQIGTTSADEYVRRLLRFINAMREVDPSIKIVAVGNNPLDDDPQNPATLWNKTVLEKAGNEIDYLSWHIYQPEKEGWKEEYDPLELYRSVCAAPIDMDQLIKRVEKQIDRYSPNKEILQAIDEWNLWLPPRQKNVSMHHLTYTMRDALYVASTLAVFFRNNHTVGMTNLAQMVNVLPLIETNHSSAIATAIFYPFVLFGQMQSGVLESEILSETFNSEELDATVKAHAGVHYLDGLSTISDDNQTLTIIFINRYPLDRLNVNLRLESGAKYIPVNALEIIAAHPDAFNSFAKPNQVRISDAKLPVLKNSQWQVTLKPCSVYFVEFKKS